MPFHARLSTLVSSCILCFAHWEISDTKHLGPSIYTGESPLVWTAFNKKLMQMDEPQLSQDPIVIPLTTCVKSECGKPMDGLRVYLGRGSEKNKANRGSICQTCPSCFWTKMHTPPYLMEDAHSLLERLLNPDLGNQGRLRPAPPPSPPSATQDTRRGVSCSNAQCYTAKGTRTAGNQNCVENMCRKCCKAAFMKASADGTARSKCQIHPGMNKLVARTSSQPPAAARPSSTPVNAVAPIPATQITATQVNPVIAPLPSQAGPSQAPVPRASLAQPLSWTAVYKRAHQETDTASSLKVMQQKAKDIRRRTVVFVIWHTAGDDPLELETYIETYPTVQLKSIPIFQSLPGMTDHMYLDVYEDGRWKTVDMSNVLNVDVDTRLLIRLRRDILNRLKDEDCPGVADEIARQPSRRPNTHKRAAHELVSPLNKVARTMSVLNATASRQESESSLTSLEPTGLVSHQEPQSTTRLALVPETAAANRVPKPKPAPFLKDLPPKPEPTHSSVSPTSATVKLQPAPHTGAPVWPGSFYTCDIYDGLRRIEEMCAAGKMQSAAFNEVFGSVTYAKSTFCNHKKEWHKTSKSLREEFIGYRHTTRGLFSNFMRARRGVEVKLTPPPQKQNRQRQRARSPSLELSSSDSSESEIAELNFDELDSSSSDEENNDTDLCPFCDEPLPEGPMSVTLTSMLEDLTPRTRPDPIPGNPHHRSAPGGFTVFIAFCERHKFEREEIPKAIERGWPTKPDFTRLESRIKDQKDTLTELLEFAQDSEFFQLARSAIATGSGRTARSNGSTVFSEQGAGYFGERGFMIATLALQHMFPEDTVDPELYAPLSWLALIEGVLLPELFVMLIAEDLDISPDSAIDTLRESRAFGVNMHPLPSNANIKLPAQPSSSKPASKDKVHIKSESLDIVEMPQSSEVIVILDSDEED
ncbi:hypothetical protein D9611_004805 [Ephemerocybe angulata]|uniref:Restriction of telomere capping protein 4 n=1 Tax=Ephemerocybe angulata TaxID=980116 RepID=A0A8H5B2X8_9AGAR|nr:hypothetical protein D9611_004805 [Tulosesus angulatus]